MRLSVNHCLSVAEIIATLRSDIMLILCKHFLHKYLLIDMIIIRVMKSRRLRWAGHAACRVENRIAQNVFWGGGSRKDTN